MFEMATGCFKNIILRKRELMHTKNHSVGISVRQKDKKSAKKEQGVKIHVSCF